MHNVDKVSKYGTRRRDELGTSEPVARLETCMKIMVADALIGKKVTRFTDTYHRS